MNYSNWREFKILKLIILECIKYSIIEQAVWTIVFQEDAESPEDGQSDTLRSIPKLFCYNSLNFNDGSSRKKIPQEGMGTS